MPAVAVCYQRQAAEQAEAGELLQSLRLLKAACVEVQLAQLGAAQSGGKAPLAHLIHVASEPQTEQLRQLQDGSTKAGLQRGLHSAKVQPGEAGKAWQRCQQGLSCAGDLQHLQLAGPQMGHDCSLYCLLCIQLQAPGGWCAGAGLFARLAPRGMSCAQTC